MHNPFLVGEHVYLRTIEESDINKRYQGWFNDPEVCAFNDHHRFPMYLEQMRDYYRTVIATKENLVLAIVMRDSDEHIGNISLQSIDRNNNSAELALLIGNKDMWGRGIAREAGALIIGHGFSELHLHRIYCGTSALNVGMQKVALALGFTEEGRLRGALFKSGQYVDVIQYGLLVNEYAKQ